MQVHEDETTLGGGDERFRGQLPDRPSQRVNDAEALRRVEKSAGMRESRLGRSHERFVPEDRRQIAADDGLIGDPDGGKRTLEGPLETGPVPDELLPGAQ